MVKNLRQDVKSTDVCNHVSKDEFKEKKFYTLMKGFGETDLPDGKRRKLKKNEGKALIRFLPNFKGKKDNQSIFYRPTHYFEHNGVKWFSECIGSNCPICRWSNSLPQYLREKIGSYKKHRFVANIIVIDEPVPENIGKCFLFEFGKQLYDVIMKKNETSKYAFYNLNNGMNLEVLCLIVGNRPTYAYSTFEGESNIDDEIEYIPDNDDDTIDDYLYENSFNIEEIFDYDSNQIIKDFDDYLSKVEGIPSFINNSHLEGDNSNG